MTSGRAVAIGTVDGGYVISEGRDGWKTSAPFLRGESVNGLTYDRKSGRLYAATHTNGVFISDDMGRTWKNSNRGLHVRKTWTAELDAWDPSTVYVGTHYGHLFRSRDSGESWQEVAGLFDAPRRSEWAVDWGFKTVGHCIHTVRSDPARRKRLYIVTSAAGPYRSDDDGTTWRLLNEGVMDRCPAAEADLEATPKISREKRAETLKQHLTEVHRCTHKLVLSKDRVYQQNHCGVYFSEDAGDHWSDVTASNEVRHGFPMVMVRGGSDTVFTIPAFQGICKKHNSCIRGELRVYRTGDMGADWDSFGDGIRKRVHTCVLRDAMSAADGGVYFGTTSGEVYGSWDMGESWSEMQRGIPRIQGVSAFTA